MDLHVAGALEFFIDHIVHAAAGVDQGGSDNRQGAAFLDVTGRTEEALRLLQGIGIHTARQHLAGSRLDSVVGTGKTGDRIEQNHHILLVLDQALGFLNHHLGDLYVTYGWFVKGRGNHFAAHGALHFGHFFRTFIDQQYDQYHIRVAGGTGVRNVLQHDRLTGFRRGDQQTTLSLTDWRHHVDDAR